jgi:carbonic anhydrase
VSTRRESRSDYCRIRPDHSPSSLKQSLKDDVAFLKSTPYIRDEIKSRVRGFLYDIKTGSLEEISA